jgi:carbohydrate-binding DOMON domain-containing protein
VTTTCYANEKVIFEMKDAVEDDYGPGSYIYPQDSQFRNNNGLFDLTYFKVVEGTDNYIFQFRFREITNPWQAKYGFSHQLIQIYIDNSDGGSRETFKQGANLKFEEQHPWNHLIKITGWNVEYFTVTNQAKEYNILRAAEVKLEQDDLIKVIIPRDQLGDLSETYYYVLIGSLDGFSYDNYRKVTAEGGDWNFSGGTDTELNPNVIDTLVPEGLSQKQVLGSFDLEEGELATLRAVGPELALSWKLVIIFAFSAVFLITFIGIVIKFIKTKLFNELD